MKYVNGFKEYLFEEDRPFLSCHASTLIVLPNGDVLASYFGGTREKANDVAIWTSRRENGVWQEPQKVADQEGIPLWNPVLYRSEEGIVYLYYKVGFEIKEWITMVIQSEDEGHTWSTPKPLVPGDVGGRGPVKNKPITLYDGTIVAPASLEPQWDCFVDLSYDGGRTWERSETVPIDHDNLFGKGIIQPTLWESAPGHVHMLTRSTEGAMYRSDSFDGGKTWTPAKRTGIPNNNSGFDLVKIENGTLVMVYNPVRPDADKIKGLRSPVVLRQSTDNGHTWENEYVLDQGISQYSYPAIVADGNDVYVTYTWRRQRIAFWKVSLEK